MKVHNIQAYQLAALRAAEAGDVTALVSLAGTVAMHVRIEGARPPPGVKWLWDPSPILQYDPPQKGAPLSLGGPALIAVWAEEDKRPQVQKWLAAALGRMYKGDWGNICREDRGANERSLTDGSRLLGVYPWFQADEKNKDLWIFVEAAHGDDIRFRRVSCLHRNDY